VIAGAAVAAVAGGAVVYALRGGGEPASPSPPQAARDVRDGIAIGLVGLRREWRASEDPAAREAAIARAAKQGTADSVSWLVEVVATETTYAARAGAALGTVASSDAAPELVRLAKATEQPVLVRANAAKALATSGGPEHVEPLLAIVDNASEPLRVRQEAALAIGSLGGAAAGKLSTTLDRSTADGEDLRIAVVQALAKLGTPEARAALARHAGRELSDRERVFVKQALRE
jgi:HEAT repeat protein